jgi:hypothetical protein
MRILALDLSKRSTGWALYADGDERLSFGTWKLGDETTSLGHTFLRLHQKIHEAHTQEPITHFFYEDSLMQSAVTGHSSAGTIRLLGGLCMHVESIAAAKRARMVCPVNMSSWRKHFIGPQRRGTDRKEFKALVIERCHQLGFKPRNDDESDAIGILDYACDFTGLIPPWRKNETLRPPLGMKRAGR